jgi:hypothetical protein
MGEAVDFGTNCDRVRLVYIDREGVVDGTEG